MVCRTECLPYRQPFPVPEMNETSDENLNKRRMNGYKLLLMPLLAGIVFSCVREPEAPLSDGQIPQETYAPDDEGVLKDG